LNSVQDFSVKRIWTEEGKLEEGMRVQEFGIREKGSSGRGELKQADAGGRKPYKSRFSLGGFRRAGGFQRFKF
jgi:hypothetical protein